jgi:hypothetical protein
MARSDPCSLAQVRSIVPATAPYMDMIPRLKRARGCPSRAGHSGLRMALPWSELGPGRDRGLERREGGWGICRRRKSRKIVRRPTVHAELESFIGQRGGQRTLGHLLRRPCKLLSEFADLISIDDGWWPPPGRGASRESGGGETVTKKNERYGPPSQVGVVSRASASP